MFLCPPFCDSANRVEGRKIGRKSKGSLRKVGKGKFTGGVATRERMVSRGRGRRG